MHFCTFLRILSHVRPSESELDDDILPVEDPQDTEDHGGENQGIEQRGIFIRTENAARGKGEESVTLSYHS